MTDLSKKILENYQIRKTRKQKQAFIDLMQTHFPELQIEESRYLRCRNLIIGDLENAKVLLSAHYDTCAALPFSNFITPKQPVITILYNLLIVIPLFLIVLVINMLLNKLSNDYWLHYFISIAIYFGFLSLLIIGPANKHTANDNTSGVITLCELLQTLPEELRDQAAFIFFDHEEVGLLGSRFFRKKHKALALNKLLVNFDCVSDGDHFLFAATNPAIASYETIFREAFVPKGEKTVMFDRLEKVYYPSDHANFEVALAATALKKKKGIYYMNRIHTKKDTVLDPENIAFLRDSIEKLIPLA